MGDFDVLVVGGGPGGYMAALTAARNNLCTAVIEQSRSLGGTCLNTGCIPSKSLLHSTELFSNLKKSCKSGLFNCASEVFPNLIQKEKKRSKLSQMVFLSLLNVLELK